MSSTCAGADTAGTAVTSENAPTTIAPITIERIASSLVTHQPTLAGRSELINRPLAHAPMRDAHAVAREVALRSQVVPATACVKSVRRFSLARPPAEMAPAAQSYSRTPLTNAETAGENVRPATEASETSRTTSGLRDESMSNAWVNR